MIKMLRELIRDIERYKSRKSNPLSVNAHRVFSQGKQDGILESIFSALNVTSGTSVEIGAWDGITFSNTRNLLKKGWHGGYIEANREKFLELEKNLQGFSAAALNDMVSLESGNTLDNAIEKMGLTSDLTLLCIDIDGNDYWVFESLQNNHPWVICIEYNAYLDPTSRQSLPYISDYSWTGGFCYGASAGALFHLAKKKGYSLVAFEPGLDLFFVRDDKLNDSSLEAIPLESIPHGIRFNLFRKSDDRGKMVGV